MRLLLQPKKQNQADVFGVKWAPIKSKQFSKKEIKMKGTSVVSKMLG